MSKGQKFVNDEAEVDTGIRQLSKKNKAWCVNYALNDHDHFVLLD